jgi:hypothetical protein
VQSQNRNARIHEVELSRDREAHTEKVGQQGGRYKYLENHSFLLKLLELTSELELHQREEWVDNWYLSQGHMLVEEAAVPVKPGILLAVHNDGPSTPTERV